MNNTFTILKKCPLVFFMCMCTYYTYAQVNNTLLYTWMKGDNTSNRYGVYGTMGTPAAANKPGGREGCGQNWTDNSGNLWLFGGGGLSSSANGQLNDLWKYDPLTNNWT